MRATHDLGPSQRFVILRRTKDLSHCGARLQRRGRQLVAHLGLVPQCHDPRHLLLGDLDFPSSVGGLLDASDAEIGEVLGILLDLFSRRNRLLI